MKTPEYPVRTALEFVGGLLVAFVLVTLVATLLYTCVALWSVIA